MNETIDKRVWHTLWHIICKKNHVRPQGEEGDK